MRSTQISALLIGVLATARDCFAHIAAFGPGMYCRNGPNPSSPNLNSNTPVDPLYQLTRAEWWFQHDRGCDVVPPPIGEFLELPAGGKFTVELANNQAFTTLSYGGNLVSDWPDGKDHPEDWNGNGRDPNGSEDCIPAAEGGYMHVQNETMAQGTAFAIAYNSDLGKIDMGDLVVFSVLEHSPWKRLATYEVPANLPSCPADGCTCAWLWVPRGCGQPNMYMQPYKCKVTNVSTTLARKISKARPPIYCANDPAKCVTGAKQMIVFNQKEGDNTGYSPGQGPSPAYNARNGFRPGAQNDIFGDEAASEPAETSTSDAATSTTSAVDDNPGHSTASTSSSPSPQSTDADIVIPDSPTTTAVGGASPSNGVPKGDISILPVTDSQMTRPSTAHSYTTTVTGRIGRPTKFTCYAEED